jgi:hypothetical protein
LQQVEGDNAAVVRNTPSTHGNDIPWGYIATIIALCLAALAGFTEDIHLTMAIADENSSDDSMEDQSGNEDDNVNLLQ